MHLDLLHALVTGVVILALMQVMSKFGIVREKGRIWDWRIFLIVFVVIFIMNLIWPAA